jgi:glucose/arabinose dehydrogenase
VTRRLATALALALILVAASCSSAAGGGGGASGLMGELTAIGAGLRGPAGLAATVYGRAPADVAALAFDPEGRLWVSTAAYDDKGTDGVYLISRRGGAAVEVIRGLHTPLGLLWDGGELYVASKERVDAYGGLVGTRFTSRRTVVRLPTGVGESNALVRAPDGRLQLGISAPCDHCAPASRYSASIVSFRADGRDLRVDAGGLRAPVGLVYAAHTSDLYVTLDQRDDLGTRTPGDWLVVVRDGQDWRFPDCYGQGGSACRGVPSPIAELDAHAGVDGVAIVRDELGPSVADSAIVAEWATGRVQQVRLSGDSSSTSGEVVPFLTGIEHPSAVMLTSTGHLLVADWSSGRIFELSPS